MLARDAIVMVSTGASPRVIVAGIRFGAAIMDDVRRLALNAGVRVRSIEREAGTGPDLLVERVQP